MDYLVETFKTGLTYDANTAFGNANAGKDLAVSLSADDTVQLAGNGHTIVGTLLEVRQNGTASVKIFFQRGKMKPSTAAITRGSGLVGAGSGEVKAAVATDTRPRGIALQASANNNQDLIDVALIC